MKWEKVKIKEICTGIYDGPHATPPISSDGAIFLGITNFRNGRLDLSEIRYISEADFPKWTKRVIPKENDIVFSYEATLNLYAIIPSGFRGCLGRRMALLRVNENKVYYKFLYYYFYSESWRRVIKTNTVLGATVDRIPLIKFPDFIVELPPLEMQYKIANILSSYDDLIENNQKQIKLLEEAAQRLYKEWFVNLRFPGYENAPIIDGVPEGWSMVKVGEVIKYEIGGGWGEETIDEKFDNPAYVIRGTDLYGLTHGDFNDIPYRFHSDSNLKARKLIDGDIIFEISGGSKNEGVARTALIRSNLLKIFSEPVMCASFCKLVRFDSLEIAQYMYDTFKYLRECGKTSEFDKKSASSIVNYRWKDFLMQQLILLPNEKILTNYNRLAINLYNQILCKSILIAKLVEARDKLLPKLMSGEIEV